MKKKLQSILSKKRNKAILFSFSASFLARIVGLVSTLVITPLILNYLTKESFGLWSILIKFVGFVAFADFGLGNGLMNMLSKYKFDTANTRTPKAIISTFLFLLSTSIILMVLTGVGIYFSDLRELFDISSKGLELQMEQSLWLIAIIYLSNIPLSIIQKVQFAWLDNHIYHFWELIQKLLVIFLLYLFVWLQLSLPYLVLGFYLPFLIANLLNIVFYLRKSKANIEQYRRNIFAFVDRKILKEILKTGLLFFLMTLAYALGRTADNIIIGKFASLETVTEYEVLTKPFDLVLVFIMMLTSVLWPAFGDAINSKDFKWLKRAFFNSFLGISILSLIISLVIAFLGTPIIKVWLNVDYGFSLELFLIVAVWYILLSSNNVLATFLNAKSILKFQVAIFTMYFVIGTPIKVLALINSGLKGFILVNIFAYLLTIMIPSFVVCLKKIKIGDE